MQAAAKTPKTDEQIKAEVEQLLAIKPQVPRYAHFGDDNHGAIDAQITVLTERMSRDQVPERFPEDGCDKLFMALTACDWMNGVLIDNETPPQRRLAYQRAARGRARMRTACKTPN